MPQIHTLKFLPSTQAIQSVADYSELFAAESLDFKALLVSLKKTIFSNDFMIAQDNFQWALTRGVDYFNNPKLFAQAPLVYVCAFVSEIFKNFEIEEIHRRLPASVLHQALLRLNGFNH